MTLDSMTRQTGGSRARVSAAIATALCDRHLLTHPFYRRWEAGGLELDELTSYAVQYRAFEAALPVVLAAVAGRLVDEGATDAAGVVARNLDDELGRPAPHLELFDRFADALPGPSVTAPGPAAAALVGTYRELVAEGPIAALAGLAAYETQASQIAWLKADGLRRWYGFDAAGTEFWDVHADLDAEHGDWTVDALDLLEADPAVVTTAARRAAEAWWALLDEREADATRSAELGTHD